MFYKTHTIVGDKTFEGQNGAPLLAASIGIGYLKEPLRYLTQNDFKNMTLRNKAAAAKNLMSPQSHAESANRNRMYQTLGRLHIVLTLRWWGKYLVVLQNEGQGKIVSG